MEKITMPNELFNVYVDNNCIAKYMPLQFALILTKAIYGEFYAEPNLRVTIEKYNPDVMAEQPKGEVIDE